MSCPEIMELDSSGYLIPSSQLHMIWCHFASFNLHVAYPVAFQCLPNLCTGDRDIAYVLLGCDVSSNTRTYLFGLCTLLLSCRNQFLTLVDQERLRHHRHFALLYIWCGLLHRFLPTLLMPKSCVLQIPCVVLPLLTKKVTMSITLLQVLTCCHNVTMSMKSTI